MQAVAQQIFYGLLVELIIVILTFWFRDNPKAAIAILTIGTIIAAVVAFYPFQFGIQTGNPTQLVSEPNTDIPLEFKPCVSTLSCPDSVTPFTALGKPDPFDFNTEYALGTARASTLRFSLGWCTKDQQLLYDHIPHIHFVFAIDGVSYESILDTQYDTLPYTEDPTVDMYCYHEGVGVSNWQSGVTYRINFGITRDIDLYDGWETFPKGDYVHTYVITGK